MDWTIASVLISALGIGGGSANGEVEKSVEQYEAYGHDYITNGRIYIRDE